MIIQCEGHDTRKKAVTKCRNCKKKLCNSCLEIHLDIWPDCKKRYDQDWGMEDIENE